MAGNQEVCEQIINALDIADLIGEKVKLRRSRRGFSGLCPFHEEKTPSFHVYTDTQSYYCFGCHEAGNIFTYLMRTENIGFREALKELADRAGISLPEHEHQPNGKSAHDVMSMAAKFYAGKLTSAPLAYLARRKIDEKDIARYGLGYAPNAWDALTKCLRGAGIPDKTLLELGLAVNGKNGLYDSFRGRVIFPIKDIAGRVIAFGGRLIDGEGAKYVNSPETAIYSKRKNLYLLDVSRRAIVDKQRSILVEGYMDAIRLHKCGFTEAVASLGTSLTAEQAMILSRLADRCYLCYDGDAAGQSAMLKSMFVLQKNGLDVYVVNLPDGQDPDEYLSDHSPAEFEARIEDARPLVEYYVSRMRGRLSSPSTRKSAIKELFGVLSELEAYEVLPYKKCLSEATGLPPSAIEGYLTCKRKLPEPQDEQIAVDSQERPAEAAMCAMLRRHAKCRLSLSVNEAFKLIHDPLARRVAHALLTESVEAQILQWMNCEDLEPLGLLARGDEVCSRMAGQTLREQWQAVYGALMVGCRKERIGELMSKLRAGEATPDELSELSRLKNGGHA